MKLTTKELLEFAQRGVPDAFCLLMKRYANAVYLLGLLKLSKDDIDPALALTQKVFEETFSRLVFMKSVQEMEQFLCSFSSYLCTQAIQGTFVYNHTVIKRKAISAEIQFLLAEIRKLPENQQIPALLHYIQEDMSEVSIACVKQDDFLLLQERGIATVAPVIPAFESQKELLSDLSYSQEIAEFVQTWRRRIVTTLDIFFSYFVKFTVYSFLMLAFIYSILIAIVPQLGIFFLTMFSIASGGLVLCLPTIKILAILERRLAYYKWKRLESFKGG